MKSFFGSVMAWSGLVQGLFHTRPLPAFATHGSGLATGACLAERFPRIVADSGKGLAVRYDGIRAFLARDGGITAGPVAIILAEDGVEIASTIDHHLASGFARVLLMARPNLRLPPEVEARIDRIDHDVHAPDALVEAVNPLIRSAPGVWFYAGYNAEYLFHPFRETRSIRDLIAFHVEERRSAVFGCVIDLYAGDLAAAPDGVASQAALFDTVGYHAKPRLDPATGDQPKERQVELFGGLRWRFEEHVPHDRRRIDRIPLFCARRGLRLKPDLTFEDDEYNTIACPWHHNLTVAICSFRTAKALRSNPGSRAAIATFRWHGSQVFQWHSQQLMDLGMMEPGQWF